VLWSLDTRLELLHLLLKRGHIMQVRYWMWMVMSLVLVLGAVQTRWQSAWAEQTSAQQDHQHASPHGGQVVTAGKYHLELVVQEHRTVQVYLYDDTLKPVMVPTSEATLYLRLPGTKNHTLMLKAVGGETATSWATTTDVLRDAPAFEAALRVALDGELRNIRFTYKDEHTHKEGQPGAPHQH
jgi:hypothetical protein